VHHGVVLRARTDYLDSALKPQVRALWAGAQKDASEGIKKHTGRPAGVVLTVCHYDGRRKTWRRLSSRRARQGIQGVLDEGLVRLARLHPEFRPKALEA